MTDALDGVTTYSYDEAGNKLTQTDAEGRTTSTSYSFDALNRLEVVTASQGQTLYTYDAVGNRESGSLMIRSRLHKYWYGNADPVNGVDPSGNITLTTSMGNISMMNTRSIQQSKVDRRIIVLNTFY